MQGLDIYAKVEHLFDFNDAVDYLWGEFIDKLKSLKVKKVLDIGCGNGKFCKLAKENGIEVVGIDLSKKMIEIAQNNGCQAEHVDLCEYKKSDFDCAVAIFDVVNYMDKEYLKQFLNCVSNVLNDGGYFIFDMNSYFGFSEIAQGSVSASDDNNFAVLNSLFFDEELITNITLFSRQKDEIYRKEEGKIVQYYHSIDEITSLSKNRFNFLSKDGLMLYSDEIDKNLIVLQKRCSG
jgi:cyclopropane fatty-acyl-phospholipid synthase-like methyltransferase